MSFASGRTRCVVSTRSRRSTPGTCSRSVRACGTRPAREREPRRPRTGRGPHARAFASWFTGRMSAGAGQVGLSEVIGAMSYALDVTEGEPPGHAIRSCKIGMRLAEVLGLDAAARSHLYYALLLKDAGCSANSARMAALFGADDHVPKRTSKPFDWSGRLTAFM